MRPFAPFGKYDADFQFLVMEHFVKCAKAVEEAGGNLKIDPSGHDGLDYHLEFLRQGKAILQDMMVR